MKWCWCFFFLLQQVYAQTTENNGAKNATDYSGATGNPYFLKDWSDGIIRFTSGRVTDKFKLKFNCIQNRLMLQFNGTTFAAESKVNEFVIYTKNKKDSFVFRKGFPSVENANEETFYQVLVEGKTTLLRLIRKTIYEEKQLVESRVIRHLKDEEEFCLFQNGLMHKLDGERHTLLGLLTGHGDDIKKFIADQQLKMRSAEDLSRVVKKYNELQQ